MSKWIRKNKKFLMVLSIIISWTVLIYFINPKEIVEIIGVRSGYILVFSIAALGGFSSFSSTSFFTTVATLANGGMSPLFLGLAGGLGLTIGDSIFYYLGFKGKKVVSDTDSKWKKSINRISTWLKRGPDWLIQIFILIYAGFTPLPNDFLVVSLGLTKYPYKKMIGPILIGDIIATTIFAYLASGKVF